MRISHARGWIGIATACLSALAAGCGSEVNLGNAVAGDGHIRGGIFYAGGPTGPNGKPVLRGPEPGAIFLTTHSAKLIDQDRVRSTWFQFYVKPGNYTLHATSGDAGCEPVKVRAVRGKVTFANVICDVV
jgi:hypothetical protein